jgi:RNA polymerase sigma factor (sigma-70 family)
MIQRGAQPTEAQELEQLYAQLAGRLRRIVGSGLRGTPDAVIDDACQTAWSRFLRHRARVEPNSTLSWLSTTAHREARKISARAEREVALELLCDQPMLAALPQPTDEIVERRARLNEIHALPQRQQRLVWLHGLGYDYNEMAGYTGDSRRTVERQLLRAKRALRTAA